MDDDAAAALDALVAALDAPMVVVTAADGDDRDGCLVGFHSQLSIEPRRYVVWLSIANRTYQLARRSTHLAVHALAVQDHAIAEHFGATTGDEVDKLADLAWTPGPGGVPVLDALPVHVVGRVVTELELPEADHVGFVLEPVAGRASRLAGAPLRLGDATDIQAGHPPDDDR